MKIFVAHINTHQKVMSGWEDVNNQVDRITHSVDDSQPLFLAIPAISHEQSDHCGVMRL